MHCDRSVGRRCLLLHAVLKLVSAKCHHDAECRFETAVTFTHELIDASRRDCQESGSSGLQ
eukprot:2168340-Prymnesium_polylepis.1